jgi:hypothetical protein
MGKLAFLLVVVVILYFVFKGDDPKPVASSPSVSSEAATPEPSYSGSSDQGSGHQAGYDWAEEKGIDNEDACDEAGDHSNSPSFAEGCKAYVEEQR